MSTDDCIDIGMRIAVKVFADRGNNSEVHLSKAELAAYIALGAEAGAKAERKRLSEMGKDQLFQTLHLHRAVELHVGAPAPTTIRSR